jgi:hypothetical protein
MTFFKSKKFIIGSIVVIILLATNIVTSSMGPSSNETSKYSDEISYRSNLGKCPTRPAGTMALQVVKAFEQTHSLRDVKLKIVSEKWSDKYFVSDYKINFILSSQDLFEQLGLNQFENAFVGTTSDFEKVTSLTTPPKIIAVASKIEIKDE